MAQYCRQCGSPLVNGRCPRCQPSAPPQAGGIGGQVIALYQSGDLFQIIPATGYGVLALVWLLRFLLGLFYIYPGAAVGWLELLASAAVAVELFGSRKNAVRFSAAALFGVMALLNLLSFLKYSLFGYNYTIPALIVLLCGLWRTAKVGWLRLAGLVGAAVLAVVLALNALGVLPVWLLQLMQCGGLTVVFFWCVMDSSQGR